ncbi:glycosyltransferase family 4 protein [Akkermansiaceae bacterium]|nr:glycosyltransferase family 4 protein [Akkermansiaceae bacterium]MDC0286842.1 glycosyltransferase family 4 protein [Akkermansiaceae bacterium]
MAQDCDITVLTQKKNQPRIEKWLSENGDQPTIHFEYHDVPSFPQRLKKVSALFNQLYYLRWQATATKRVEEIAKERSIDFMHHVTYASFRYPVIKTDLPVLWGPIGGAEMAPKHLLFRHGKLVGVVRELCRNVLTTLALKSLGRICPVTASKGLVLASTPKMRNDLSVRTIPAELFPTIGIETDLPDRSESERLRSHDGSLKLLYVGRIHPLKGLHLVLEAMEKLADKRVSLTIIGSGSDRGRLESLVKKFDLSEQVSFAGYVDRSELEDWFESHDVLVAPSLYESGGMSVLEAGMREMPALVLDCGGHSLSVIEGGGVKVDPTLPVEEVIAELAGAMNDYREDRTLIGRHGKRLMAHLESAYDWRRKRLSMLEIYQKLLR